MKSVNASCALRCALRTKDLFLCILSACLLILSFPNYNLWVFSWFGLVPLFFAIKDKPKGRAFLLSYFTGIIFWLGTIYWLVHVTLPGMMLMVLYLALYFGVFGLIFVLAYSLQLTAPAKIHGGRADIYGAYSLIFLPSAWVLLEYIRSRLFSGFPWALLGYSQYLNLPVIQIADITGAWGVSFLVVMINVAIYTAISRKLSAISKKQKYLLPVLILFITLTYGYFKIYSLQLKAPAKMHGGPADIYGGYNLPLRICVIQANIPQERKWVPESGDYIMGKYLNLSREAMKDNADLLIWPEAALPVILEEEPVFFEKAKTLAKEAKKPLLLGAATLRDGFYYNSALLLSGEGRVLNRHDKLHLVPFGEYIPLRDVFPFLEKAVPIGDFTAGKEYTVFTHNAARFSVLICFEDLFPGLARRFVKRGADFLVNITNDAWFKKTSSPYQHLQASVFRAAENRVNVVRAANTGVSGFISPSGRIISLLRDVSGENIFIAGFLTENIVIAKGTPTFYTRYGDVFVILCLIITLYKLISKESKVKSHKP